MSKVDDILNQKVVLIDHIVGREVEVFGISYDERLNNSLILKAKLDNEIIEIVTGSLVVSRKFSKLFSLRSSMRDYEIFPFKVEFVKIGENKRAFDVIDL